VVAGAIMQPGPVLCSKWAKDGEKVAVLRFAPIGLSVSPLCLSALVNCLFSEKTERNSPPSE
jgi:hypothetical protein